MQKRAIEVVTPPFDHQRRDESAPLRTKKTGPISVSIQPSLQGTLQAWGLEQLLIVAGIPYRFEASRKSTIYYGFDAVLGQSATLWIPAQSHAPPFESYDSIAQRRFALLNGNRFTFDLGRDSAYWLSLESEADIAERDAHGRVPAHASRVSRFNTGVPPIHEFAELLLAALWQRGVVPQLVPRWPHGKRFAAVLTHDVDEPEHVSPGGKLIRGMLTGRDGSRRSSYWALQREIDERGLRETLITTARHRREWDFSKYIELEANYGLRSVMFFSVVSREMGHPCDVNYDASLTRYRRLFGDLVNSGCEVGLHAGYLTRIGKPRLAWQMHRLSSLTRGQISGLRHHYLQIDPRSPMSSLWEGAECKLTYDSSVGFNDAQGFRAGIALPYFAPPTRSGHPSDLLELPMTIADMHLSRTCESDATEAVLNHLRFVETLGGMAVLNWHVGHWHRDPVWRKAYMAACEYLAADASVWVVTPKVLETWWRKRASLLRDGHTY